MSRKKEKQNYYYINLCDAHIVFRHFWHHIYSFQFVSVTFGHFVSLIPTATSCLTLTSTAYGTWSRNVDRLRFLPGWVPWLCMWQCQAKKSPPLQSKHRKWPSNSRGAFLRAEEMVCLALDQGTVAPCCTLSWKKKKDHQGVREAIDTYPGRYPETKNRPIIANYVISQKENFSVGQGRLCIGGYITRTKQHPRVGSVQMKTMREKNRFQVLQC